MSSLWLCGLNKELKTIKTYLKLIAVQNVSLSSTNICGGLKNGMFSNHALLIKFATSEKEIILEEINQLELVMKRYEEDEEYEHAAFMKKRIENLKKRL